MRQDTVRKICAKEFAPRAAEIDEKEGKSGKMKCIKTSS